MNIRKMEKYPAIIQNANITYMAQAQPKDAISLVINVIFWENVIMSRTMKNMVIVDLNIMTRRINRKKK